MRMKPSALGYLLLVLPDNPYRGTWQVANFSAATGEYGGATVNLPSKAAAVARRRRLVRHHARLAKERAARKRTK